MGEYKKRNPIRDVEGRRAYALAVGHCQACGVGPTGLDFRGLSVHHIAKPGRSDELCNLLVLCGTCHDLAEGHHVRVDPETAGLPPGPKILLPLLPPSVCVTIKAKRDPENHNLPRLLELWGRFSLDPEPIPEAIEDLYRKRRGK